MYSKYHSKRFYLSRLFYREVGEMFDGRKLFCQAVVLLRKDKDKLSCPCFFVSFNHLAVYSGGLSALTVRELHDFWSVLTKVTH